MTSRPWKLVSLLTGIFLAGAVVGGLLTHRYERGQEANRRAPERWAPNHLRQMARDLDLTLAQREKIEPIVRKRMEELGRMRAQSMGESRQVFEQMWREVGEVLTPEQRAKFTRLNQEFRERVKRRMEDLNRSRSGAEDGFGRHRPRPPGPPPEGDLPPDGPAGPPPKD